MAWQNNVTRVVPYTPGEQPKEKDVIKLNTNECPYPPAPGVAKALQEMDAAKLRLYPDPQCEELVCELANYYKVNVDQVFVGVGSDDVLAMAFLTFFKSEMPILFPDVTYSFYDVWAELYRIPYETIPLDNHFHLCCEDYNKENGGIIIPNPNAPTGVLQTVENLEKIIANNQESIVIIDEAYIDFGGKSCIPLVEKYNNVLVVQTFSKSRSLAGLRVGFAIGNKELITYLHNVKHSFNSYTMNQAALTLGVESVKDDVYFKEIVGKVINTRERLKQELSELGFILTDSYANFLFVTHHKLKAKDIFEAAKKQKIYIRYFNKVRIDNYLRISIGTDEDMNALLLFLKKYIQKVEEK